MIKQILKLYPSNNHGEACFPDLEKPKTNDNSFNNNNNSNTNTNLSTQIIPFNKPNTYWSENILNEINSRLKSIREDGFIPGAKVKYKNLSNCHGKIREIKEPNHINSYYFNDTYKAFKVILIDWDKNSNPQYSPQITWCINELELIND